MELFSFQSLIVVRPQAVVLERFFKIASYTTLLVALFWAGSVNAGTYFIQPSYEDEAESFYGNWLSQTFTGVTGVVTGFEVAYRDSGVGGSDPTTYRIRSIFRCTDSTLSDCDEQNFVAEGSFIDYTFDLDNVCRVNSFAMPTTTELVFSPNQYGYIEFSRQSFTEIATPCGSFGNPKPTLQPQALSATTTHDFDNYLKIYTDNSNSVSYNDFSATSSYQTRIDSVSYTLLDSNIALCSNGGDYLNAFPIAEYDGSPISLSCGEDMALYQTLVNETVGIVLLECDTSTSSINCDASDPDMSVAINTLMNDSGFLAISTTTIAYGVELTAEYLLSTSEIVSTISAKNPTHVQFQLAKRPNGTLFGQGESIDNTVNGTGTVSTTFTALEDGTYDVLVKFSNAGCAIGLSSCPFPLAYIYSSFTLESGEITNVGENEVYNNVIVAPTISQYEDCGLSNLSGCLNNSLRFLFIPSTESLDDLIATKDQLDTRIPFVYVSDIRTVADEVFNSSQTETLDVTLDLGFGTVPLINESMIANAPQANTIRTLLSYMLWITFALGAYRMALGIHNKETT